MLYFKNLLLAIIIEIKVPIHRKLLHAFAFAFILKLYKKYFTTRIATFFILPKLKLKLFSLLSATQFPF
jgi:membrane-bound metal-dependent hydrolase YbcI (DUF457 family)